MGLKIFISGFILIALCASYSFQSEVVPVLIWSYKNPDDLKFSHNSLHNYDTSSFTSHLQKIMKHSTKPLLLAFIEPILSVEDFSMKPTAFNNVKNDISNSKLVDYIPKVHDALEGIQNLQDNKLNVKEITDTDDIQQYIDNTDVLIIKLSENYDDGRFKSLEKQDRFISETYQNIYKQRKNVIGLLSGELSLSSSISSLMRFRRSDGSTLNEFNNTSEFSMDLLTKNVFIGVGKTTKSMLYSKTPATLVTGPDTKFVLRKDSKTDIKLDERADFHRLIILFYPEEGRKISVRYKFDREQGNRWSLNTVEVEYTISKQDIVTTILKPSTPISSKIGQSFLIKKPIEFSNDSVILSFPDGLQVQPFIVDTTLRFGAVNSDDDVVYFTTGIWMGIFVMAIVFIVFSLGITAIMDIKTMDRFDDAKGKTININTTE